MSVFRKIFPSFLITAIVFGAFLRLYYGLLTDLWGDEAISFFIAKDLSWFELFTSSGGYWIKDHPPLYFIFLKLVLFFSQSDVFLRATSLFWFLPSLYLVWLVGKEFSSNKQTLIAMSLFSLHPLLVNLSFQVRPYSLAIFLVLVSIYLFILQVKRPNFKKGVLLGLFLSLSFWTSYASVWLIIGMSIFLALQIFKHGLQFLVNFHQAVVAFVLLSLFQFVNLFFALFKNFISGSVIAGSVSNSSWAWFVQELGLVTGLKVELLSLFAFMFVPVIFLRRHVKQVDWFIVILFVGSIFSSILFSISSSPIFLARQLLVAAIALIFIIAKLASNIRGTIFAVLIVCIYACLSLQTYGFLFQGNINQKVQQHVEDGDLILIFENNHDYLNYYLLLNNKQAEVAVLSMDRLFNQNLITELRGRRQRLLFFMHYCPDQKYSECHRLVDELQNKFCDKVYCRKVE